MKPGKRPASKDAGLLRIAPSWGGKKHPRSLRGCEIQGERREAQRGAPAEESKKAFT